MSQTVYVVMNADSSLSYDEYFGPADRVEGVYTTLEAAKEAAEKDYAQICSSINAGMDEDEDEVVEELVVKVDDATQVKNIVDMPLNEEVPVEPPVEELPKEEDEEEDVEDHLIWVKDHHRYFAFPHVLRDKVPYYAIVEIQMDEGL